MKTDKTDNLTKLGSAETKYEYSKPNANLLEVFENQFPHRKYLTEFIFNEFTSLCPKTGQPDFAVISVKYIPKLLCIETKSLKLYYLSYRQHGSFMETIVNNILEDLVKLIEPHYMQVKGVFNPRGGTDIIVTAVFNTGSSDASFMEE